MIPPTLFFFFKIVLAILRPMPFCLNYRISLSIVYIYKNPSGILTEIELNL